MKFGTKNSEVPAFSGGDYIRALKKGETTLRFLQETTDWVMYREHYGINGRSFPCLTDDRDNCPGCTSEFEKVSRSSRKYAANVLIKPQDTHVVIKMPVTLLNKFEARTERNNGTILNRDYLVIKSGDGLETEYDIENGDSYAIDLSQWKLFDVEAMLKQAFNDNATGAESAVAEPQSDDPPSKPRATNAQESEVVISEAQLRKMSLVELTEVALGAELSIPATISDADALVDFLLDKLAS